MSRQNKKKPVVNTEIDEEPNDQSIGVAKINKSDACFLLFFFLVQPNSFC